MVEHQDWPPLTGARLVGPRKPGRVLHAIRGVARGTEAERHHPFDRLTECGVALDDLEREWCLSPATQGTITCRECAWWVDYNW